MKRCINYWFKKRTSKLGNDADWFDFYRSMFCKANEKFVKKINILTKRLNKLVKNSLAKKVPLTETNIKKIY